MTLTSHQSSGCRLTQTGYRSITEILEFARNQGAIDDEIGYDLSIATIYRPLFTQNIVLRVSAAMLIAGDGWKDIYRSSDFDDDRFYSILANLILLY